MHDEDAMHSENWKTDPGPVGFRVSIMSSPTDSYSGLAYTERSGDGENFGRAAVLFLFFCFFRAALLAAVDFTAKKSHGQYCDGGLTVLAVLLRASQAHGQ